MIKTRNGEQKLLVHCNLNTELNFLLFPSYYYATVCAINRNWKRKRKENGENRSQLLEEYIHNVRQY